MPDSVLATGVIDMDSMDLPCEVLGDKTRRKITGPGMVCHTHEGERCSGWEA